ncbi:MAG: hypothetical protein QQN46_06605 [Nitrosopumilus sp.]
MSSKCNQCSMEIKCIFMDEAAKWNLVEYIAVMNAIKPIVDTNNWVNDNIICSIILSG